MPRAALRYLLAGPMCVDLTRSADPFEPGQTHLASPIQVGGRMTWQRLHRTTVSSSMTIVGHHPAYWAEVSGPNAPPIGEAAPSSRVRVSRGTPSQPSTE